MNLGTNRLHTFFFITLPLVLPGMITSAIFAFITSFHELVVANFISGIRGTIFPKRMFDGICLDVSPLVASVSSMIIVLSILTILFIQSLQKGESGDKKDLKAIKE